MQNNPQPASRRSALSVDRHLTRRIQIVYLFVEVFCGQAE